MCGIVLATPSSTAFSHKSLANLSRRGPDGIGFWADDAIQIGHTRLAIIGLDERGREPLESPHHVLTFNGEIYNFERFREQLIQKGYPVEGANDSETLLYCWQEWGIDILREMSGFWAFAIYDKDKKTITLVRDQFGVKPLYYAHGRDGLVASSLLRTVIELLDQAPELDFQAMSEYVRYQFTFGDKTFVKQVRKVLPGHAVEIDLKSGEAKDITYDDLLATRPDQLRDIDGDWMAETREKLPAWILESTISDTSFTTICSGGLDSSLITLLSKPTKTFHAYYSDPDCNELAWVKRAAQGTDIDLVAIQASESFDLVSKMDSIIEDFDELSIGSVILPLDDLLAKVTEENKVVLVGTGGDELFGGYSRYQLTLGECHQESYRQLFERMEGIKSPAKRFEFTHQKGNVNLYKFYEASAEASFFSAFEDSQKGGSIVDGMLQFDRRYFLAGLLNIDDKMCGRHSLEGRPSFLHQEMVRHLLGVKQEQLMRGNELKPVMRELGRGILPQSIVERKDKMGFTTPIGTFSDNSTDRIQEQLAYSKFKDFYQLDQVEYKSVNKYSREIFGLLALDLWLNKFAGA